jgi:hypothetical protein
MSADSRLGALKLPITSLSPKISDGRVADVKLYASLVQHGSNVRAPSQPFCFIFNREHAADTAPPPQQHHTRRSFPREEL